MPRPFTATHICHRGRVETATRGRRATDRLVPSRNELSVSLLLRPRSTPESPPFDLNGAYEDSSCLTPLIFILSPGADINDYLLALAEDKGKPAIEGKLKIISLGQGQGPVAESLMGAGRKTGDWVCLQNCHLSVSWLPKLEQILEAAGNKPADTHADFRLWLTSMPSEAFPVPILQTGIKITNEPPKGMRANLTRSFLDMSEADYNASNKPLEFQKLLYTVAFFNALVLERRKFGAVGWNIPYGWMNSDLKTAIMQVRMYVDEAESGTKLPWETLNVLVADVTYGGRVTDKADKRTISAVMRRFFKPELLLDSYRIIQNSGDAKLDDAYRIPAGGTLEDVVAYLKQLPVEDSPEVFGLDPNADINFQQKERTSLLERVILLGGSGGGGGGDSGGTDALVAKIAAEIEARMPDAFDARQDRNTMAHPSTFERSDMGVNSMGVFLSQELVMFNGLIRVMKSTLYQLQRAIKGIVVMSGPLEDMYNAFLFQRVPPAWEKAGYPCLKPLTSWTEDFFGRIAFIGDWLRMGPQPCYWLPSFFFPQGFMTSVKQTYSRKYAIAVDTLLIGCEVMPFDRLAATKGPPDGVYIYGLYMEGARFDRKAMQISESLPSILFDEMPCIWLKPSLTVDYDPADIYDCPLYKTSIRAGTLSTTGHSTNFVVELKIPSKKEQTYWINRGTAMLCMLDT